jgi:ElaB/YqjD/DUF883 family membrane-anchored ribosome-binding protein
MSTINSPGIGGPSASTPYPGGTSSGTGMDEADMAGGARHAQQRATETIDRIASSAHDTVDRLSARAASVADRMGSGSAQYYDQTREYVVANPMRTVGIAVLAGFLLGRLMR